MPLPKNIPLVVTPRSNKVLASIVIFGLMALHLAMLVIYNRFDVVFGWDEGEGRA